MRILFASVFVLQVASSWGQTKYKLIDGHEQEVGSATYAQKLLTNGSKQVILTLALKTGYTIKKESVYDAKGQPIRMLEETSRGENRVSVLVEFSGPKATLKRLDKTPATSTVATLGAGLPYADKTAFWFVRDIPAKGASEFVYSFTPSQNSWRMIQTEYKGQRDVTVQGKKWKGHVLLTRAQGVDSEVILDDQGIPILIESTLRFERIPEPKTPEDG